MRKTDQLLFNTALAFDSQYTHILRQKVLFWLLKFPELDIQ